MDTMAIWCSDVADEESEAPGVGDLRKGATTWQSGNIRRLSAKDGGPRCIKEMFASVGRHDDTNANTTRFTSASSEMAQHDGRLE